MLMLGLRHWEENITLEQANALRRCLYSLEMHAYETWAEEVWKRI